MSMKMGKVVPLMEETEPAIKNARVISVSEKGVAISISGITKIAQVAFSCLVRPIAEDLVLCAKNETGLYYILSIIERPDQRNRHQIPGDRPKISGHGQTIQRDGQEVSEDRE